MVYSEKVLNRNQVIMAQVRKEIRYIDDTPIRIILDDEISMLRGKLPPHHHD